MALRTHDRTDMSARWFNLTNWMAASVCIGNDRTFGFNPSNDGAAVEAPAEATVKTASKTAAVEDAAVEAAAL